MSRRQLPGNHRTVVAGQRGKISPSGFPYRRSANYEPPKPKPTDNLPKKD